MRPAKAVERNEIPFSRDTRVFPVSNIVLDRGPGPHGKGRFGGLKPPVRIDADYRRNYFVLAYMLIR